MALHWVCSGLQVPKSPVLFKLSTTKVNYMLRVKEFQLTEQIQLDRHVPIAHRPRSRIDRPRGQQDTTRRFHFTIRLKLKQCNGKENPNTSDVRSQLIRLVLIVTSNVTRIGSARTYQGWFQSQEKPHTNRCPWKCPWKLTYDWSHGTYSKDLRQNNAYV